MSAAGEEIDGIKSPRVFTNVVDFDASSMYPSIARAFDIDPEALIGAVYFDNEEGTPESKPEFMEVLLTNNPVEIGSEYFNLPSLSELIDEIS